MSGHEEDLLPENNSGYKLSQPKQSLAEYQKMVRALARGLRRVGVFQQVLDEHCTSVEGLLS
ncbi:rho GDP dissociation inhibitor [Podospora pseudoanserina]|uniref:Rho GDP dissociation inhibitor n=1 Tax=Podospora pseudoanserina TaxID=2609844 RepID=A0ABR0HVJ3_9PEZI|nr:rho GDP dissociation inhibitor [Podospora pseudoanserina]